MKSCPSQAFSRANRSKSQAPRHLAPSVAPPWRLTSFRGRQACRARQPAGAPERPHHCHSHSLVQTKKAPKNTARPRFLALFTRFWLCYALFNQRMAAEWVQNPTSKRCEGSHPNIRESSDSRALSPSTQHLPQNAIFHRFPFISHHFSSFFTFFFSCFFL